MDQVTMWNTYQETVGYFEPLMSMMQRGILVDAEGKEEEAARLRTIIHANQEALNQLAGTELNALSPKQISDYFYVRKGVKPFISRTTGKPTTDDKAMSRLAAGTKSRKPFKEALLVQSIRGDTKMAGTYLEITLAPGSLFKCTYNPRGTKNGRFSSSKTLSGIGMNQQNIPYAFKKYMIPREGNLMFEWDKRQAEWVVVAYLSGDEKMIEVIENGQDAHLITGCFICDVPEDFALLERQYVGKGHDPVHIAVQRAKLFEDYPEFNSLLQNPDVFLPRTYYVRDIGKHSNHGYNYDMSAYRFSEEYETDILTGARTRQGYLTLYPGVPDMWNMLQDRLDDPANQRTLVNCHGRPRQFLGEWGNDLFKEAYNYHPQSTVADTLNHGMRRIYDDRRDFMRDLWLLFQVHDSLGAEYPTSDPLAMAKMIHQVHDHMDEEMSYGGRPFRIATDMSVGFSWGSMIEVKPASTVAETAKLIPAWIDEAEANYATTRGRTIRETYRHLAAA